MSYSEEDWKHLGRVVAQERRAAGHADTKAWVTFVGMSDRQLLGLERGEPKGQGTLTAVERALKWPEGWCYRILSGREVGPPGSTPATAVEGFLHGHEELRAVLAPYRPVPVPDDVMESLPDTALLLLSTTYSHETARVVRELSRRAAEAHSTSAEDYGLAAREGVDDRPPPPDEPA